MTCFVEGDERPQSVLFAERLDYWVGEENPMRVVDALVDELNLRALGFERTTAATKGRPGYHSGTPLKIRWPRCLADRSGLLPRGARSVSIRAAGTGIGMESIRLEATDCSNSGHQSCSS